MRKIVILFVVYFLAFTTNAQVMKSVGKQMVKKEVKQTEKKTAKQTVKAAGKASEKVVSRAAIKSVSTSSAKGVSAKLLKIMGKEVAEVFTKGGYKEVRVVIKGSNKPLLVSPKFDPYLKISRNYTGDFDPVKFHGGNPRFVKDGCETNLGRMKRGLAPLYKDPTNTRVADHGYSAFDLHHGGQKANPEYFALMAEDHKVHSSVLHQVRKGSEINRAEFSKKERAPLYMEMAEYIDYLL